MSYTALQNSPITINLPALAQSSGWTIDGAIATHEACNAGNLYIINYPLTAGQTYNYTYQVVTIGSGYVQSFLGTSGGAQVTTTGFVNETVTAAGINPQLFLFANGNCTVKYFTVSIVNIATSQTQTNTIAFAEKTKKWVSYYTYIPYNAFTLFINTYSFFQGNLYVHQAGSATRNNFYGVQYQSTIQFVDNVSPTVPKTFMSLSMQCNQLMITTPGGITTSLGQVSELAEADFIKDYLTDGTTQVNVLTKEGVYSANLLRDSNSPDGLLNGDPLKGNYMVVNLISTNNGLLALYTINIIGKHSPIGAR